MKTRSLASENLLLAAIIAIAFSMGFRPMLAGAADTDLDGYTDDEERSGVVAGGSQTDPAKKDLNVVLVRDSTRSNINLDTDPLQYLGLQGLGLAIHFTIESSSHDHSKGSLYQRSRWKRPNPYSDHAWGNPRGLPTPTALPGPLYIPRGSGII